MIGGSGSSTVVVARCCCIALHLLHCHSMPTALTSSCPRMDSVFSGFFLGIRDVHLRHCCDMKCTSHIGETNMGGALDERNGTEADTDRPSPVLCCHFYVSHRHTPSIAIHFGRPTTTFCFVGPHYCHHVIQSLSSSVVVIVIIIIIKKRWHVVVTKHVFVLLVPQVKMQYPHRCHA